MTEQQRFPLSWPNGWKRATFRSRAPFSKRPRPLNPNGYALKERLDVGDGLRRLTGELKRLGAATVVISSNMAVREDGLPYAKQPKMLQDPGVAVYFRLGGKPRVLACDKWNSVADNMAAIAGHIEAIRACDRYGVGTLDQAFAGYTALVANTALEWRTVFGFTANQRVTLADVDNAFREASRLAHPDAGGSHEAQARLGEAKAAARKELSA